MDLTTKSKIKSQWKEMRGKLFIIRVEMLTPN